MAAIADTLAGTPGVEKLKASGNQPHEIVEQFLCGAVSSERSGLEARMLEALWASMLAAVRDKGALKPALALVDVSGSMKGLPMTVAIALGLFISELAPEPWRGNMITFTAQPAWFSCPTTATTLGAKVAAVREAYKKRFAQESVGVVSNVSCAAWD